MVATLIVGDANVTAAWVETLLDDGHHVETCESALSFQHRFSGEPPDVVVVDVVHADHGEAMLIPQIRAKWPDCRVIATVRDYSFSQSKFYRMGLWSPDEVLLRPLTHAALRESVARWGWSDPVAPATPELHRDCVPGF